MKTPTSRRRSATAVHVILPALERGRVSVRRRETVHRLLRRTGWDPRALPTICVIDGAPLLRRNRAWKRRRIRAGEHVEFRSRPRGGGAGSSTGKSVIGLVGLIALAALAPGFGSLAATALGIGGIAGAAGILGGAFVAGGSFLLNTLLTPKAAKAEAAQATLYSFGQQTNSARPMQTIGVKYGRVKSIADLGSVPWAEYIGDDQYLNLLLVRGCGRYQPEQILIDDTVLWDSTNGFAPQWSGVDIAWYEPGEEVTLFALNVASAAEVSNQELADINTWVGPFAANAAGTSATSLAFDVVWSGGLYLTNAAGKTVQYGAQTIAQVRLINDAGAPIGDWIEVVNDTRFGASKKPMRVSFKVDVPAGRYEGRMRRGVPAGFAANAQDQIIWTGMRAFLAGPRSFPGVSTLAIRMKSTAQLTGASSGKFGLIETRILPTWNGSSWVDAPTRLPAWAMLDIATNTDYGCERPLSKVDVQAVADLAVTAAARGDYFDYEFRSAVQATEALDTSLAPARAKSRWLGDVLSLVREQWQAVPSMLLTDREIVRGSLSVTYQLASSDSAEAVVIPYLDETTWQAAEVQYPPDVPAAKAARTELPGAVRRNQVFREAKFLHLQNVLRRVKVSLTTEHDGRLLSFGSVITVQSELPQSWGAAGAVMGQSGLTLTLSPAPAWEAGQSYVVVRQRTGRPFGPVKISRGASDALGILNAADLATVESQQGTTLAAVLARRQGAEPPSFALGLGTAWQRRCIVLSGRPDGDQVSLELVVDDAAVHDDSGEASAAVPGAALSLPKTPLVAGLVATLEQNVIEPALSASWWPAAGALYYVAQISYDGRATWAALAQVYAPSLSVVVEPRALSLRVAAVGSGQGAWTVVDLEAPTIDADRLQIGPDGLAEGLRDLVRNQLGAATDEWRAGLEQINLLAAEMAAHQAVVRLEDVRRVRATFGDQKAEYLLQIGAVADDVSATVTRVETLEAEAVSLDADLATVTTNLATVSSTVTALADGQSALASEVTELSATVDGLGAVASVRWVAGVTPAGATAAWDLQLTAGTVNVGITAIALSGGGGQIRLTGDRVAFVGASGTPYALFTSDGSGALYLNGSLFADGSILGRYIGASVITADKLVLGGVTTDRIYPSACTNSVFLTSGSTVIGPALWSVVINRISGTYAEGMIIFSPVPQRYQESYQWGAYYITVDVHRNGALIYSRRYRISEISLVSNDFGVTFVYSVGLSPIVVSFKDSDSLPPGDYTYSVSYRDWSVYVDNSYRSEKSGFTNAGFSDVSFRVTEFKR